MPSITEISDDALKSAIANESSFRSVCRALGLECSRYIRKRIRERASKLGVDLRCLAKTESPFSDKHALVEAVRGSTSYRDVMRKLGAGVAGNNYKTLKKYLGLFKIDAACLENGTSAGARHTHQVMAAQRVPLKELLVEHSPASRKLVKRRILEEGLIPYICAGCANPGHWNGRPLTLALEHKNGVSDDHRIENLEFLCPNCHSQTPTFAGRNIKKGSKRRAGRRAEEGQRTRLGLSKAKRNTDGQRKRWLENQVPRLAALRAAGIDFTKHGWVTQAAAIINLSPQKVSAWLKKVDPELYATCKHRKAPSRPLGQPAANDANAGPLHLVI